MTLLSEQKRVVLINVRVPREWESNNNDILRGEAHRYPNLRIVDWHDASANHAEYFWNDGMHLRPEGAQAYVALILAALAAQ